MKIMLCAALILMVIYPVFGEESRQDFTGSAQATFSDPYQTAKTCSYTAMAEVKVVHDPRYSLAFTYSLHRLTPLKDDCFRVYPGTFTALCRSWVTSVGTMNIDVVGIGLVTVTPTDPAIRQVLSAGSLNANYGFGPTLELHYEISRLPDGGVEWLCPTGGCCPTEDCNSFRCPTETCN